MRPNLPAYFCSWADEITSRADRIRQLIGDRHWLSDGTHKEFLFREFLSRHLPSELCIGRGFVRSLSTDEISPEIDLLIFDAKRHVPLFNEGGMQVVPPSAVIANIEVKSTYQTSTLESAIKNVARVRSVARTTNDKCDIWSCIMFVTGQYELTAKTLTKDTENLIRKRELWQEILPPTNTLNHLLPNVICVLDKGLLMIDVESGVSSIQTREFFAEGASAALALAQLFAFVRATLTSATAPGELDQILEQVQGIQSHTRSITHTLQ